MRLELTSFGKIVLREVAGDAAEYIESERSKLVDPDYQHWCFSKNYDGTVYVTITPYEDKVEIVEQLDVLADRYGLTVSENMKTLLSAWRMEAMRAHENKKTNAEIRALESRINTLQRVLREGCEACTSFCFKEEYGRCKEDGKILHETPISPRYGPTDGSAWGQRWYPHDGCKYLTER